MATIRCTKCDHEMQAPSRTFMEEPSEALDKTKVMELAEAIARSGSADAAVCLDLVFRDEPEITEWIAQARCGRKARLAA